MNGRLRDPIVKFFPLIPGDLRIKSAEEQQGNGEFRDRRGHGQAADPYMIVVTQQQQSQRARDRQERKDR